MRPIRFGAGVLLCALAACSDTPVADQAVGPQYSMVAATITGRLLAPDGTSICTQLPASSATLVQAFNATSPYASVTSQTVTCPADAFSLNVTQGSSYYVTGRLSLTGVATTTLPRRRLVGPVTPTTTTIKANIKWQVGHAVGGGAYLDGAPFDAYVSAFYSLPGSGDIFAETLAGTLTGGWSDLASPPRANAYLGAATYFMQCPGDPMGTKLMEQSGPSEFAFPGAISMFRCDYDHSLAGYSLSHHNTDLLTTADAGGFGSLNYNAYEGAGWGVQYPRAPGSTPSHWNTELFYGGLLLGFSSTQILSGIYMDGYSPCVFGGIPNCRDLGPSGTVGTINLANGGRRVRWTYTDDYSTEKVGLRIQQTSYDGPVGSDYVAFQYKVKNTSNASISFHPGVFMDWDVTSNAGGPASNIGSTAINGQLMYVRSSTTEKHLGTLIAGVPIAGNHFRRNSAGSGIPFDVAAQYSALSGASNVPTSTTPGDVWYVHSGAQVTLAPGATTTFWVALVGGSDQTDIIANAKLARTAISDGSLLAVSTASPNVAARVAGADATGESVADDKSWEIRQAAARMMGARPGCKLVSESGIVARECVSARPTTH
jgi:hypothetical protein